MPVRGAGYPEGAFAMERLLDRIADELGLDRAEVRRRNLVPPEKMPYARPSRPGPARRSLSTAATFSAVSAWRSTPSIMPALPRAKLMRAPKVRYFGIGLGNGVKGTGRGPFKSGIVRIGRSGRISVYTGAMPMGQGIKTALAQICAEQFDIAPDSVAVAAGDTAVIPYGQGGFASRQTVTAGSAVHLAAVAVRDKALKVAAHLLEVSVMDLELRDGRIEIAGAPGSGLTLREVAEAVAGVPGYSMPGKFEPGRDRLHRLFDGEGTARRRLLGHSPRFVCSKIVSMIAQAVLSVLLCSVLVYSWAEYQRSPTVALISGGAGLAGLYFVWFPSHSTRLAELVGVGRGADLIFYIWVCISLIILLNLHLKLRTQHELITTLARTIALAHAGCQTNEPRRNADPTLLTAVVDEADEPERSASIGGYKSRTTSDRHQDAL